MFLSCCHCTTAFCQQKRNKLLLCSSVLCTEKKQIVPFLSSQCTTVLYEITALGTYCSFIVVNSQLFSVQKEETNCSFAPVLCALRRNRLFLSSQCTTVLSAQNTNCFFLGNREWLTYFFSVQRGNCFFLVHREQIVLSMFTENC